MLISYITLINNVKTPIFRPHPPRPHSISLGRRIKHKSFTWVLNFLFDFATQPRWAYLKTNVDAVMDWSSYIFYIRFSNASSTRQRSIRFSLTVAFRRVLQNAWHWCFDHSVRVCVYACFDHVDERTKHTHLLFGPWSRWHAHTHTHTRDYFDPTTRTDTQTNL